MVTSWLKLHAVVSITGLCALALAGGCAEGSGASRAEQIGEAVTPQYDGAESDLRYPSISSGPICFAPPDARVVDGELDVRFTGSLIAVLAPTDSADCPFAGMIFDDERTLLVECLRGEDDVAAFSTTCRANAIPMRERPQPIATPCPPPALAEDPGWGEALFASYRPE